MNYVTSDTAKSSSSDRAAAGFLVAGLAFIVGYTLVRAVFLQPAVMGEATTADSVVSHEATLWNTDVTDF